MSYEIMRRWCRFGMGIRVTSDGVAINQTTPTPIASEKVSSNVAAAFRGKARYTVTLTEANVERAKKRESNFSGLLYRLFAKWLANSDRFRTISSRTDNARGSRVYTGRTIKNF